MQKEGGVMKLCLGVLFLLSALIKALGPGADWQFDVPAKEHVASYQVVCEDGNIYYSVNGETYQYYLELEQQTEADEKNTFVVLSNDRDLMYQTVYDSLISSQQKNYEKDFYFLGYEEK